MEQNKEYFVFISYSSLDNEWAIWLRHELEHYHLPASFNGRTDVRNNLRKVFRDRDELSAGPEWDEQVQKALEDTNNLIVICSPHSAKSDAVNKEIETFIALGKEDHIFPFIVEGDKPEDCFPPALRHSKLGGDVNKDGGRDSAFIKVVAGMLKVSFPSLWNRYEIEKAEEERKIREQRDKLLIMQSRFLAEKANALVDEGDSYTARLLALEALPKDLGNPDRPYVPEAEIALRNATKTSTAMLIGHKGTINSLSYNPQDNSLLSTSGGKEGDGEIRLWDCKTGKCIQTFEGYSYPVYQAEFSPDRQIIASCSWDSTVRFWSVQDCKCICELYHKDSVNSLAFNKTGEEIASVSRDGIIKIWSTKTYKCIRQFDCISNSIHIVYSKFNNRLFSVSQNDAIRIWDTRNGTCIATIKDDNVSDFALSPDEQHIAIASKGNGIMIWEIDSLRLVKVLKFGGHFITSLSYSPTGITIITTSNDNTIRIWNVRSGKCIKKIKNDCNVDYAIFGRNDNQIMYVSKEKDINIRELDYEHPKQMFKTQTSIKQVVFSQDSNLILAVCNNTILLWDAISGIFIRKFNGHGDIIDSAVFNSKGDTIISSSRDKTIRFWDVSTGKCSYIFPQTESVKSIILSKRNDTLIILSNEGTIRLWDFRFKREKGLVKLPKYYVGSIIVSPDSKYFAIESGKTIQLWDIETLKCLRKLELSSIMNCVFNNASNKIIASDEEGYIIIWDFNKNEWDLLPINNQESLNSICVSNDDSIILSSQYGITKMENIQSGICFDSFDTSNHFCKSLFSPDNSKILIVYDKYFYVKPFSLLSDIVRQTSNQFKNRQLTLEERKKYYLD